jgi:hypothetical protein
VAWPLQTTLIAFSKDRYLPLIAPITTKSPAVQYGHFEVVKSPAKPGYAHCRFDSLFMSNITPWPRFPRYATYFS